MAKFIELTVFVDKKQMEHSEEIFTVPPPNTVFVSAYAIIALQRNKFISSWKDGKPEQEYIEDFTQVITTNPENGFSVTETVDEIIKMIDEKRS